MPEIKFDTANIVFVLGGPGSGKGTQCANLMNELKFSHISSGDIFRSEVKKGSELGQTLNQIMRDGKMVPLDITKLLLINEMNVQKQASGFLLDGYPRTLEQAKYFEKKIAAPRLVLYYEAPTEVLVERLLNRAKTSGRVDDNMESIIKRIRTFEETTKPLVDYYESLGILKRIDATRSVDEITRESLDTLDESELTKRS
ncbi:adenylate kinase 1 [Paraphysoderma sedebokerense]|nr:adenylate kinase 1 [Paraphysoderma sedebokerense]